ncbi:hypothetical protein EDD85DRAFT_784128 [Armillaria nabsnona]|nr:hypothetical protein EDD85DRAFT_784128 [Armillaria nabsnona]
MFTTIVFCANNAIYQELGEFVIAKRPTVDQDGFFYSYTLLTGFWTNIACSEDPTLYTITHLFTYEVDTLDSRNTGIETQFPVRQERLTIVVFENLNGFGLKIFPTGNDMLQNRGEARNNVTRSMFSQSTNGHDVLPHDFPHLRFECLFTFAVVDLVTFNKAPRLDHVICFTAKRNVEVYLFERNIFKLFQAVSNFSQSIGYA